MPTREETQRHAVDLFEAAIFPQGMRPATAWLGIYQVLLWLVPTETHGLLPHIIDADKFRPTASRNWCDRAIRIRSFICKQLGCDEAHLPEKLDLLMRSPGYVGLQRQNPLGIAFAELIAHVLRRFGDQGLEVRTEVAAQELFPAVHLQSRSVRPRVDIVPFRSSAPAAIITTKWSVRHDRLADVIDEAISYKTAAVRTGLRIPCFFMTNEFDPARLDKIIGAEVVDAVVHVNPELLTRVCGLNERLALMKDLDFLRQASHKW